MKESKPTGGEGAGKLSDEAIRRAEDHRAFVREVDSDIGKAYGTGGGLVVALAVGCVVGGWWMGGWGEVWLWTATLTAVLASLYGVRRWIYAKRDRWRDKVDAYCEVNGLEARTLAQYYDGEALYPFFATIYEPTARERLAMAAENAEDNGDQQ